MNLEYLGRVVFNSDGMLCPDSVVGTDSHTTMINGLGIVGWGMQIYYVVSMYWLVTCASSEARHKFRFAPCFFFINLCRGLQPLDVILDIQYWTATEKPSLAYTVRTQ